MPTRTGRRRLAFADLPPAAPVAPPQPPTRSLTTVPGATQPSQDQLIELVDRERVMSVVTYLHRAAEEVIGLTGLHHLDWGGD